MASGLVQILSLFLFISNSRALLPRSSDGVAADADMRRHLGQEGLKRITDVRLDDLYVFTDGDEIPKLEILLFLKIYDGIPQLVALHNIWSIFGFFWQVDPAIYGGGIH